MGSRGPVEIARHFGARCAPARKPAPRCLRAPPALEFAANALADCRRRAELMRLKAFDSTSRATPSAAAISTCWQLLPVTPGADRWASDCLWLRWPGAPMKTWDRGGSGASIGKIPKFSERFGRDITLCPICSRSRPRLSPTSSVQAQLYSDSHGRAALDPSLPGDIVLKSSHAQPIHRLQGRSHRPGDRATSPIGGAP